MSGGEPERERADRVAARVTGVGVGLLVLMPAWLVGSRLAALVWPPPLGPTVAFLAAIALAGTTALIAGAKLVRRVVASP